jgi:hypothetical protein
MRKVHLVLLVSVLAAGPVAAVEWHSVEGPVRAFPTLRDLNGRTIAAGDFTQWIGDGRLHVAVTYAARGRRIREAAVFRQRPELVQEEWSFDETRDGRVYRKFAVDFRRLTATAKKRDDDGELETWSESVEVTPGRAFAGFGIAVAIKALRDRLLRGETIALETVGFSPKPRAVTIELSYGGRDRLRMSGRTLTGDRFIVHPKLPLLADLFVDVPDARIWMTTAPATFLRWEGPLAEPGDPITRVDGLPGEPSGPATPIGRASAKRRLVERQ